MRRSAQGHSRFGEVPVLEEDTDGEGPRTPTMSRERVLADLDELLRATEWLAEGRLEYQEALQCYFERFLRLHGGTGPRSTRSTMFTRSSCSAEGDRLLDVE